jgi:hypothetical protein
MSRCEGSIAVQAIILTGTPVRDSSVEEVVTPCAVQSKIESMHEDIWEKATVSYYEYPTLYNMSLNLLD